jgi:aspartyl-tRNA(Asn)/glutamyl-tRNA(Gln) amidotransferase subunit B
MDYEAVIGLEVHAELATRSKMFCGCPVVDPIESSPNTAVCPICSGMPGTLPAVNQRAVELSIRVALALSCKVHRTSIFARKNYFYPDLPKGYQISQYEYPLATEGYQNLPDGDRSRTIRIRRVHLEEDTGKLTHITGDGQPSHSLLDLNRAGIPLLEIVTEPDFRSAREVRTFAENLRTILRYLNVNSGDMQKGVLRIEPNVSIRLAGDTRLDTRTEIKNLNSFRAIEKSIDFEIQRQLDLASEGKPVVQQTLGWDEENELVVPQRSKEEAHDYRYFPEPDLPPLIIDPSLIEQVQHEMPELPQEKLSRFQDHYGLNEYDARILTQDRPVADYFEKVVHATTSLNPKMIANWITADLFRLLNSSSLDIQDISLEPEAFGSLIELVTSGEITHKTGTDLLAEIFNTGASPEQIIEDRGLRQISDPHQIEKMVNQVLDENPDQVETYLRGKDTIAKWLFGQVMRLAGGKANPQLVQQLLEKQLAIERDKTSNNTNKQDS